MFPQHYVPLILLTTLLTPDANKQSKAVSYYSSAYMKLGEIGRNIIYMNNRSLTKILLNNCLANTPSVKYCSNERFNGEAAVAFLGYCLSTFGKPNHITSTCLISLLLGFWCSGKPCSIMLDINPKQNMGL